MEGDHGYYDKEKDERKERRHTEDEQKEHKKKKKHKQSKHERSHSRSRDKHKKKHSKDYSKDTGKERQRQRDQGREGQKDKEASRNRGGDKGRQGDKDRDRNTERQKQRDTKRDIKRDEDKQRQRDRDRDRDRDRKRDDDRQKDKKRDDDGQRERERVEGKQKGQGRDRDIERDRNRDKERDRNRDQGKDQERGKDDRNKYREREMEQSNEYRRRSRSPRKERPVLDEKDPYFEQRRQIERVRRNDPDKAQKMQTQLEKKMIIDKKQKEYDQMKEKFKDAQKQMEEAKREDHTILVYCLPLKAKEKDIWNFFYKSGIGKIRDIRIIKDGRSGKSKGVAYVQFYASESVEKALTMTDRPFQLKGRQFMGLRIQHSQAEKNRAAAAAKKMRVIKPVDPYEQAQENLKRQMKVLVGGLTDKLADIQESELKSLFEPFGSIDYVDIHRDAMTGKCKGFAFINYTSTQDAKAAVKEMNGLTVGGQKITVQTVSVMQKGDVSAGDDYLYSQGSKQSLMNKFARGNAPTHSNLMRPPISTVSTQYLLLTNLFTMDGTSPGYFEDLKKEVMTACQAQGVVEKCFVEKNNQGNVWVKFSDSASATKAIENLNGKYFDDKKVFCYNVTENTYQSRVGV